MEEKQPIKSLKQVCWKKIFRKSPVDYFIERTVDDPPPSLSLNCQITSSYVRRLKKFINFVSDQNRTGGQILMLFVTGVGLKKIGNVTKSFLMTLNSTIEFLKYVSPTGCFLI